MYVGINRNRSQVLRFPLPQVRPNFQTRPSIRARCSKSEKNENRSAGDIQQVQELAENKPKKENRGWLRGLGARIFAWQLKSGFITAVQTNANPPATDRMPPLFPHTWYRIIAVDDFGNVALKNDSPNPPIFVPIDANRGNWNPEVIISIDKLYAGVC